MKRVQSRLGAGILIGAGLSMFGLPIALADNAPAPAAAAPAVDWDLTDLYATPKAWDDSYAKTRTAAE
ncbi:MAG TPA: hypothetical protein VK505_02975, partial [Steroidobacteraceae bacterium]|nr:hypothetical protein [Steroidobacteraceae bacterium]